MKEKKDNLINGGYISIARQIIESDVFFKKPATWLKMWMYILLNVNYRDNKRFKRGMGLFRWTKEKEYLHGISKHQWHNFLRWSRDEGMLTTQKTTRGTIIKVLNYKNFQNPTKYAKTKQKTKQKQNINDTIPNKDKKDNKGKEKYAEFVELTPKEYQNLFKYLYDEFRVKEAIKKLDNYKGSTGRTYASDYRTILNWVADEILEKYPIGPGQREFKDDRSPDDKLIDPKKWEELKGEIKKIGKKVK